MSMFAFALDLKEDPAAIAEYEAWHRGDKIPPAIVESLRNSGLIDLKIFRTGNRLFLLMEAPDDFSLEAKARDDAVNSDVQAWERLMWNFQRALPWAAAEQKWVPMHRIFSLADMWRSGKSQSSV